ncbi:MAG: hypothetical protein AAGC55_01535, partial [Myxococcota bacterium]
MNQPTYRQSTREPARRTRSLLSVACAAVATLLATPTTYAQEDAPLPPEVVAELGPVVVQVITENEWAKIFRACPQQEIAEFVACLGSNRRAGRTLRRAETRARGVLAELFGRRAVRKFGDVLLMVSEDQLEALAQSCAKDAVAKPRDCLQTQIAAMAGDGQSAGQDGGERPDYPAEALELLPRPVLDALPKVLTQFLRGTDYQALKQECPQDTVEGVLACLDTTEVTELLDKLHSHAVIASLLEYMDVELPNRLTLEDYDLLTERCAKPGESWAMCAFENGMDSDKCFDSEEVLAQCVVDNDMIGELYLGIVRDKKAIFGKELYVEFAGLMAVLPLDMIELLREACPQTDRNEAAECFQNNDAVAELVMIYFQIAEQVVADSIKDLAAAGKELTPEQIEEYTIAFTNLFLTLPSRTIISLASTCQKLHPELEPITDPSDLDKGLACMEQAAQTNPVANPAYISKDKLRIWLQIARDKVIAILAEKELTAQNQSFRIIIIALSGVAGFGFLLMLLMPLFLKKKYPDRIGLLWKASLIGATTFALTVALLGATLVVMKTVQGRVATQSTSPKMTIAQGVFDVLTQDEYIEGFSELSKLRLDFVKGPLRNIVKADVTTESPEYAAFIAYVATHWSDLLEEPELKPLAKNIEMLKSHQASFRSVIGLYKQVDWIMG